MQHANVQNMKRQGGFSLAEVVMVLAVIGTILGVAIGSFGTASSGTRSYSAAQNLTNLQAGIRKLYPAPNFTGLNAATIVQAGKAPDSMVGAGNTLVGQWGGTVTLAPADYNGGTSNAFTVTYPGIPQEECNDLIATVAPNFVTVVIGTSTVKDDAAGTALTTGSVVTACNNASNTVVLTSAS